MYDQEPSQHGYHLLKGCADALTQLGRKGAEVLSSVLYCIYLLYKLLGLAVK